MKSGTIRRILMASAAAVALVTAGCGGGSSSPSPDTPASATVTSDAAGKTTAPLTLTSSDGIATVTIPQGTVLYADTAGTQPVSGTVTVTVSAIQSTDELPADARTARLSGGGTLSSIGTVADLTIAGDSTTVQSFRAPITVNLKLPQGFAAPGAELPYYSFDGTSWNPEGTASVKADGSLDMAVTHLSLWGGVRFAPTAFTTEMLAGKKIYRATMASYGSFTLNSDGTVTASGNTFSGVPTETTTGSWSITDGKLNFNIGESMTFTLEGADDSLGFWKTRNAEGIVYFFYNPDTGLNQAMDYYTAGGISKKFSDMILEGRQAFWANGAGYGSITFRANGTFTRSMDCIDGNEPVETVTGTWGVGTDGKLFLSPGFAVGNSFVMADNITAGRHWLVSPAGSSATQRWYYDQATGFSSALSYFMSFR